MSSPILRHVPTPEEHIGPLTLALCHVAERSFFAVAEPCSPSDFADLVQVTPGPYLESAVSFVGAFAGRVTLVLPVALAREFLAAFMGETGDDAVSPTALVDVAGELANMACGKWLTDVCGRRRFDLHAPEVRHMASGWVPSPKEAGPGGGAEESLLTVSGMVVIVRIDFTAE
jgi:hypothetical protein